MWESFVSFNVNGVGNFIYILTSNPWFLMLLTGFVGTVILQLKEEVDTSIREEQNII